MDTLFDANDNYFIDLNRINVQEKIEKKNRLSYLSWAYAWGELKKRYPDAVYTIYENKEGWCYHTDGRTCWVKTGVTVNGIEHIEYLPVMDFKNHSISAEDVTSFDVNKAIQRSLTKAVARHGLGLYVYAGEDLPEDDPLREIENKAKSAGITIITEEDKPHCSNCGAEIKGMKKKDGTLISAKEVSDNLGGLCKACWRAAQKEAQ